MANDELRGKEPIAILSPGTRCHIANGQIEALITAVQILGTPAACITTYEVTWWNGRERMQEWLQSLEIQVASTENALPIGFVHSNPIV